jgi:hypothetical protein
MKLNNQNRKDFYKKIIGACKKGDVEFINEVLNSDTISQINDPIPIKMLFQASGYGHLEIVQALYKSNLFKNKIDKTNLVKAINTAFSHGHIKVIQFLFPQLNRFNGHHDNIISLSLTDAAVNGQVNVIQAFFEDNLVKNNLNKDTVTEKIINTACCYDKLDVIKYIMEKEQYKYFDKNIHNLNNTFATSLVNESLDVIQYFIFDLNITKTPEIHNILQNNIDDNFEKVKSWFKLREVSKEREKLEDELPILNKETHNKKPKM